MDGLRALDPGFDPRDLRGPSPLPAAHRVDTLQSASAAGLAAAAAPSASPLERAGEIAAPAGRALVSLGAGATHRRAREFLPWSAVAAVVWTGYSVGVGYVGGQLLGASWLSTGLSVLTLFAAGCVAARALRSSRASEPPSATPAPQ